MDLFVNPALREIDPFSTEPPCRAKYRPVFWEPVPGTGERIVALVAIEPHSSSQAHLAAATHCVLSADRLRSLLGRQRGASSLGVLTHAAAFMTQCQNERQVPLAELEAPFFGFYPGPVMNALGYSVEQLLDIAVRSVSAFGSADDIAEEAELQQPRRHMVKTSEFLKSMKRVVAGDNSEVRSRFEKRVTLAHLPDMTVDYAFRKWLLQVTSLPSTRAQTVHAQRESQSKLFELEQLRKSMSPSSICPVLLINDDAIVRAQTDEARSESSRMLERLVQLAGSLDVDLVKASTPEDGAKLVLALN